MSYEIKTYVSRGFLEADHIIRGFSQVVNELGAGDDHLPSEEVGDLVYLSFILYHEAISGGMF